MESHNFDTSNGFTVGILGIANPAAATDFVSAVTAGVIREVTSIRFTLTTDATAPSRRAAINFNNGAVNYQLTMASNALTASLVWDINFGLDQQNASVTSTPNHVTAPLPSGMYLSDGFTLASLIINMGVADQLSDIIITYRQWILST